MSTQLHIAEPCHEDWNEMQPNEKGRHCEHCCKTVIDFSAWETADILQYLQQNKRVCGRLRADQLSVAPQQSQLELIPLIAVSPLSYIRKMAAVVAVLFVLTFCGNEASVPEAAPPVEAVHTLGEMVSTIPPVVPDTPPQPQLMKSVKHAPPVPEEVVYPNESYVQGGISFPDPPEPVVSAPVPPPADTLQMGPFPE